jgi:hypothetical protein
MYAMFRQVILLQQCLAVALFMLSDSVSCPKPTPVAALSKARVCDRSLAGIVGSNPAGGMDVGLLCVSWFVS